MSGRKTKAKPQRQARKLRPVVGPVRRAVLDHSTCGSQCIGCLDWRNWWLDSGFGDGCYLHVRHWSKDEGETYHRVYPRKVRGRECHRIAMYGRRLYWLHDRPNKSLTVAPDAQREAHTSGGIGST